MINKILISISILVLISTCSIEKPNAEKETKPITKEISEVATKEKEIPPIAEIAVPHYLVYAFQQNSAVDNLAKTIPAPTGYQRIKANQHSFAEWLRYLPVKPVNESVRLYNGKLKNNQNVHQAIINIDVGKRDLQQCADAVMRLRAEYCYSKKDFSKIHFNFTSGDRVAFEDWAKGRKPKISGNKVTFTNSGSGIDTSYPNFRKYMDMIFNYAGTASLSKELKSVNVDEMRIGDVFIQGGFPGHAVLVVDMAENEQGEKLFLLSQSYMPAQDIHILKNYNNDVLSPWYSTSFGDQLNTPEWTFSKKDLKRFN